MQMVSLGSDPETMDLRQHGSHGVHWTPLLRSPQTALDLMRFEPGGTIGAHDAGAAQLFVVVAGAGWATGADGVRVPVEAGQAAYWDAGERHESGTPTGMLALVVQTDAAPSTDRAGLLRRLMAERAR